jgi:hypothetical protein
MAATYRYYFDNTCSCVIHITEAGSTFYFQ